MIRIGDADVTNVVPHFNARLLQCKKHFLNSYFTFKNLL